MRHRILVLLVGVALAFAACEDDPPGRTPTSDAGSDTGARGAEAGDTGVGGTDPGGSGSGASSGTAGDRGGASARGGASGASGQPGGEGGAAAEGGASDGGQGGDGGPLPPDDGAPTRLAGALGNCGAMGTAAAIEALARAGIETRDVVTGNVVQEAMPPVRGLRVWNTQARAMACDIANGAGITGRQLDDMVGPLPLPNGGSMPFSTLLAAYVSVSNGPFGSRLGAALMGSIDRAEHADLVYPTLVVVTFLREVMLPMIAQAEELAPIRSFSSRRPSSSVVAADPCAAISEFLDDLPAAAMRAVGSLAPEEEGFWGRVVSIASTIAGVAAYATAEAARTLIQHLPFADAVRGAMAVASAISDIRSMFTNWELVLTPNPPTLHKSVGGTNNGTFTLNVPSPMPAFQWPAQLSSCAALLNVALPEAPSADQATVEWQKISGWPDPVNETGRTSSVSGGTAELRFAAVVEPMPLHNEGICELSTDPSVKVQIGLPGLESLGSTLAGLMGSPAAAAAVGASASAAASLLGPSTQGSVEVTYHPTTASITFDNGFEQLNVSSSDGVGPNGSWTGTWGMVLVDTGGLACGPRQTQPVSWQFAGGVASVGLSFSFPGNVMDGCGFTFTETVRLQADPRGGCMMTTMGSYSQTLYPPMMAPPIMSSGARLESYSVDY